MDAERSRNLQEIIRQRQRADFIGRSEEIDTFRGNLGLSPNDPKKIFVFNIWGQGGVGKTTLLRQFQRFVEQEDAVSVWCDEDQTDVLTVMEHIARQLQEDGYSFDSFSERYHTYLQKREELEADPSAPEGLTSLAASTLTRVALHAGRSAPGFGAVVEMLDHDALAAQAGQWAEYVRHRLSNRDEVRLILNPLEVLTPLFLRGFTEGPNAQPVVFFFDTYERTRLFLDGWLRDLLEGRHGDLPTNVIVVIAGRDQLSPDKWSPYEPVLARIELNPFSEKEAMEYLSRHGITDHRVTAVILELSGHLPLLVATLAAGSPTDPTQVHAAAGTAVERFLRWVDDAQRRQLALMAAIPRVVNRDILDVLLPSDTETGALFSWLRGMPFVRERSRGWGYHEVVRMQMLRYAQRESHQSWRETHRRLANYYRERRDGLKQDFQEGLWSEDWQRSSLDLLYHNLCQEPQHHLPEALKLFLRVLRESRRLALRWAQILVEAGRDSGDDRIVELGSQLTQALEAVQEQQYAPLIETLDSLRQRFDLGEQKATALAWRAESYRRDGQLERALKSFNEALALEPDYDWAIARRGDTLFAQGRHEEALSDFNRLIEESLRVSWALANRGMLYLRMEKYEEALTDFNEAMKNLPEQCRAYQGRGKAYLGLQKYEEALAEFSKAITCHPDECSHYRDRGKLYQKIERNDSALDDFDKAIELHPDGHAHYVDRGSVFLEIERYEQALADFNRATELRQDWCKAYQGRAKAYLGLGKYEEALADFDRAVTLDTDDCSHYQDRGEFYQEIGRYDSALSDFNKAIELHPDGSGHYKYRAAAYESLGRYEEALADYKTATQVDPDDIRHILGLANAYKYRGRYEEARLELKDLTDNPVALAQLAEVLRLQKNYAEAIEAYTQAISSNVDLPILLTWAVAGRGISYQQLYQTEAALADFDRALSNDSDFHWAYYQRGVTHKVVDRLDEAKADLDNAIAIAEEKIEREPSNYAVRYNLVLYYLANDEAERSRQTVEELSVRFPHLPALPLFLDLLSEYLALFPNDEGARAMKDHCVRQLEDQ